MPTESFIAYTTQPELAAPRVNWFGVTPMMQARGSAYDNLAFTLADVQFMADLATIPGPHHLKIGEWQVDFEAAMDAPFILDFEQWWDVRHRVEIISYIQNFRRLSPGVRLGVYPGGWMYDATKGWMNNDDLYFARSAQVTRFMQGKDDFAPIAELIDFVSPSVYPMQKEKWKRDQFVTRMMVGWCRRFNKPVLPFVFGGWRYFDNGVERAVKMNIAAMSQYAEIMREEADGAIVWGKWAGNQTLIDVLER